MQTKKRIQLSIRAENLKNVAGLFKGTSDPYAILSICEGGDNLVELGRTETVKNSLHPHWATKFEIDYDPNVVGLSVNITLYDETKKSDDVFMGEAVFHIGCIFDSESKVHVEELDCGGRLYIHVDESHQGNAEGRLTLQLRGLHIKNVESGLLGLGRSDPFYEIAKRIINRSTGEVWWDVIYRSEPRIDSLNPFWESTPPLDLDIVCFADLKWPLRITVYDWQKSGKHRVIGWVETTLGGLMANVSVRGNADRKNAFEILNEEGVRTGTVVVVDVKI